MDKTELWRLAELAKNTPDMLRYILEKDQEVSAQNDKLTSAICDMNKMKHYLLRRNEELQKEVFNLRSAALPDCRTCQYSSRSIESEWWCHNEEFNAAFEQSSVPKGFGCILHRRKENKQEASGK